MKYIPDGVYTKEEAQQFVEENMGDTPEKFVVVLKTENRLIGHMYFHKWFAPQHMKLDGYLMKHTKIMVMQLKQQRLW